LFLNFSFRDGSVIASTPIMLATTVFSSSRKVK